MIDLTEVGAFPAAGQNGVVNVRFGIYLPDIQAADGFSVLVRIIHQADRFDPGIPTQDFALDCQANHPLGLWNATVDLNPVPNTRFGQSGVYLYRYQLLRSVPNQASEIVTTWFTDPFARETDIGELSAFTTPDAAPAFQWDDANFKVPELDDLIVYELNVEEFNSTFDGVIERLTYLKSLGVNVLELMPVTSLKLDFDWGYGPLHYYAPSQRLGGPSGLKRLVNECHKAGIAVVLDVVYQHVDGAFPYKLVYDNANKPSPMIGSSGWFGPQVDFSKAFAQDYFAAANSYWLSEFHVDGFRYDEVDDYYFNPTDTAYVIVIWSSIASWVVPDC